MKIQLSLTLVASFAGLTSADFVIHVGDGRSFRHSQLLSPLHEGIGFGPGESVPEMSLGIWDESDEKLFCELTDQAYDSSLEEIMQIPVEKFRKKRENQIVLYRNARGIVNCSTPRVDLLRSWILPILTHFWDTHFVFLTPQAESAPNPYFYRAILKTKFSRDMYSNLPRAMLISADSEELNALLDELKGSGSLLENSTIAIEEIDENPIVPLFDSAWYRFLFQGLFVTGLALACLKNISILRRRYTAQKLKTTQRIYMVIILNILVAFFSSIFLAIDGYAARGGMSSNLQNSFRSIFFGLNSAGDFLIGAYWLQVVKTSSITSLRKKKGSSDHMEKVMLVMPVLLVFLDVLTFLGFNVLDIPFSILYSLVPGVLLLFQIFIIVFMLVSTQKILKLIDSTGSSTAGAKKSNLVQRALMRRLAFWIRISSLCSGIFVVGFLCVALQSFYLESSFMYIFINASLIVARIGGIFAKGQFCAPPPKVKVGPSQATGATSSAQPSTAASST